MRRLPGPAAIAGTAVGFAILIAVLVAVLRPSGPRHELRELADLRARRAALRDTLSALVARDSLLAIARSDSSGLTLALSEEFLASLLQGITTRYLDHVAIDLGPGVEGHGGGDININTPFGRMTLGEWAVAVDVRQFGGVLSAGRPRFEITGPNRVHLEVPVRIQRGSGEMKLRFEWNSRSVFNAVCRDFKTEQIIRGTVLPQEHRVHGDLVLSAAERGIAIEPRLPREKFPISMELDAESWNQVRKTLADQDKLMRCGLLINPDSVIARLQGLGRKGLRFRLPRVFYHTVVLPAGLSRSVRILDSMVEIEATPRQLLLTPGLVWFGADVKAGRWTLIGPPAPAPEAPR